MADLTLEELQEKARAKRATRPTPPPKEKRTSSTAAGRQDVLTPAQRRQRSIELYANQFKGINIGLAMKAHDEYYMASDEEALQWGEAAVDTQEWLGLGEVPPPVTLLVVTLNFYIPRAYHYWVTGRTLEEDMEPPDIEGESTPASPPQWVPSA